jgi:hypothetical protein
MSISDRVPGTVEVLYSNIGEDWTAAFVSEFGRELVSARGPSRAAVLRLLADELEAGS